MLNSWRRSGLSMFLVAAMLLVPVVSATQLQTGTATTEGTEQAALKTPQQKQASPDKATSEPRNKSVLDDDVLNNPLSYLQDAFSSDEEDAGTTEHSGKLVITLKALVATLLSTVI